jgi:chaperonin cofactor prefoldin
MMTRYNPLELLETELDSLKKEEENLVEDLDKTRSAIKSYETAIKAIKVIGSF